MPGGEEGLKAGCRSVAEAAHKEAEARDDARRTRGHEQTVKPSYHPRLSDHPMSARPADHPSPLRLASRTGIAELSGAW
jgi:hypothetical protein